MKVRKSKIKNTRLFIIISILGFIVMVFSCSKEESFDFPIDILSDNQYNKSDFHFFNHLVWKTKLNIRDKESITRMIQSTPNNYQHISMGLNVMLPSLVHKLTFDTKIDSSLHWKNYHSYFVDTGNISDKEFDNLLYLDIKPERLQKNVGIHSAHYESKSDVLVNALVIRNCKSLRNSEEVNIELPDSILTHNQKELIRYSKLPNNVATDMIIKDLMTYDEKIKNRGSGLLMVLRTYNSDITKRTLKVCRDTNEVKTITNDGKTFLLWFLEMKICTDLSKSEQLEFVDWINKEEIYDGVFCEQKSFIASITHVVTGEELEKCWNRVGIYRDIQAEKKEEAQIRKYLKEQKEKRDKRNAKRN